MVFAQYVALSRGEAWERIRSQMRREERKRASDTIDETKATTTRYNAPFPSAPEIIKSWHISGHVKTHRADATCLFHGNSSRAFIMNGYSPTCSKAPMGQIARVETLSSPSCSASFNRPPPCLIRRGDKSEQLGTFRCFFFFSPSPLFHGVGSLLLPVPFLARLDVCVLSGRTRGKPPLLARLRFGGAARWRTEASSRGGFPASESSSRTWPGRWRRRMRTEEDRGIGRRETRRREEQASAWNRSLTAVVHALPFLSSRPGDGYRARHATACNAARCSSSYGPPGVPGHSSGNRSAGDARGTR